MSVQQQPQTLLGILEQQPQTLLGILEQALSDDELLQQLADDPLGTLKSAGTGSSSATVKHWFGVPSATDREMVQMLCNLLRARRCSGG